MTGFMFGTQPVQPSQVSRLEREAMAWPPASWEKAPGAWRDDIVAAPEPFVPYAVTGPATEAIPVPAGRGRSGYATFAREFVQTIALTALIFVGIRLLVQNFRIEGRSMEPTLHSGEYLLVSKLSYIGPADPGRGDIIVFQAWNQDKDFIKRVVGIPGDTIEVRDGCVRVNGNCLDEPYLDQPTTEAIQPITLGDNEYYVMGDNRGNSSDSRAYGPLPADRIIGKAWVTYWPPGDIGLVPNVNSYASSN
jgi:signal peptidase I